MAFRNDDVATRARIDALEREVGVWRRRTFRRDWMAVPSTRVGAVCVLLVCACGGGDPTTDAAPGTDGGADAGVAAAPDIPWLAEGVPPIAIAPCPDGWRETTDPGGVTTCEPYPEGGALDCPDGEAHFVGEPGCAPVGSACPSGDFSDALPADRNIVYVQPGATGDGTSPATPYGSVMEFAFGGLPRGTVVALSRGMHEGPVRLAREVVLWGACAAATTVTTSTPSDTDGVVTIRNAQGEVRDLTAADSPRGGISVNGAGAEAVVDGVVLSNTTGIGFSVVLGARAEARAVVVRETQARSDGLFGRGLGVEGDAVADVSRAVLERNRDLGAYASREGTMLTLTDAVLRDTESRVRDASGGRGLSIQSGASAELGRVVLERNLEVGLSAAQAGTGATLSDVIVRDTQSHASNGTLGRGLNVQLGAVVEVSRALVERNRDNGAFAAEVGTMLTLADVVLRDTESRASDGSRGRGLSAQEGAIVETRSAVVERNRQAGFFAMRGGTMLTLADLVVRDIDGDIADGRTGRGLSVQEGAAVDVSRAVVERNRDLGALASADGTMLTLSDVVVRDTESRMSGTWGRGLNIQLGASAEIIRAVVERNHDLGVLAAGPGTVVTLTDTLVREVLARSCSETTCIDEPAGHGVGSYLNAALSMNRFVVAGANVCGIQLARGGEVDLSDGEVRECTIGVCLQVEPYDSNRLTSAVRFIDNGTNLQATSLPVPEPAEAVPAGA